MPEKTEEKKPKAKPKLAGKIKLRGRTLVGTVISDKMARTVTVAMERRKHIPKYERYERRYTKVHAHNPDSVSAAKGDLVKITETRPISKTKHFTVVKVLKKNESS